MAGGHTAGYPESVKRVPLPDQEFQMYLIDGPQRGKTWLGATDSEGRFQLSLDVPTLPPDPCLVAVAKRDTPLYTPAVAWSAKEIEFRAYSTTSSLQDIQSEMRLQHTLVENQEARRYELDVELYLLMLNSGSDLYVGQPASGQPAGAGEGSGEMRREIFRVPIPADARILINKSSSGGRWTELQPEGKWKWMVLDSPIPPSREEERGVSFWQIKYRVPARQKADFVYPITLPLAQFLAIVQGENLTLVSSETLFPDARPNGVLGRTVKAGTLIPIEILADNAPLGQPNYDSLLLLGVFILGAGMAIAGGLLLGMRGPSLESVLEDASGDEIIARIAQLDARRERGEIDETTYRGTREKLLGMARYVVSELKSPEPAQMAGPPPRDAGGRAGPALPEAARALLERLRALEEEGPPDAGRIHERALLLEELARVLTRPAGEGGSP